MELGFRMPASFHIKNHHLFELSSTHLCEMTIRYRTTSFEAHIVLMLTYGGLEQFWSLQLIDILESPL